MDPCCMDAYLHQLEKKSRPSGNDVAYPQFVCYINAFLRRFCQERVYLVGSTTENLKVRWSKDGGDADLLILSGKLEIPVADLQFRTDTPCHVWVNVDKVDISKNISLIEGKYLPSDVLRNVGPELFTFARGIYLLFTSGTSYVPGDHHVTKYGIPSKVGLALSEYRGLEIEGKSLARRIPLLKRQAPSRNEEFRRYMMKRRSEHKFYKQDIEFIERVIEFVSSIKTPGSVGVGLGYWEHFAYLSRFVLERTRESTQKYILEEDTTKVEILEEDTDGMEKKGETTCDVDAVVFENDLDAVSDEHSSPNTYNIHCKDRFNDISPKMIRATYSEKTSKDFVPALKIVGPLECMDEWKRREHRWLSQGEVDVISRMDVFCVARYAPVNPSRKDFCLSFTLAESKLSECLSPVQRTIVLIMKAFLKGTFTNRHKERDRDLKLTTFHVKTILYRVCDITDPSEWSEVNVAKSLTRFLQHLKEALENERLLHYFVQSNLFAGFEKADFKLLLACTSELIDDPISGLQAFLDLDDDLPHELWLTEDEANYIETVSRDGGVSSEIDKIEEFIFEVLRGLKEGPRDARGIVPIKEAISDVIDQFVRDEAMKNFRKVTRTPSKQSRKLTKNNFGPILMELFGNALVNPLKESLMEIVRKLFEPSMTEEEKQAVFNELRYIIVAYCCR